MTMICLVTCGGFPMMFSDILLTTSGQNTRFDPPDYSVPTNLRGNHEYAVGSTKVQQVATSQKMVCLEDGCIIGVSGPLRNIKSFLKALRKMRTTSEKSFIDLADDVEANSAELIRGLAYIMLDMNADGRTKFHNVTASGEKGNLKYYACGSGAAGAVDVLNKMEFEISDDKNFYDNPDGMAAFVISTFVGFEIGASNSIKSNWGGWIQAAYPKTGERFGFKFPDKILFCMWICHVTDDADGNKRLQTDHMPYLINMSYLNRHLVVRRLVPGKITGQYKGGLNFEGHAETIFVTRNLFDEKRRPVKRNLKAYPPISDFDAVSMCAILLYGNQVRVKSMWDKRDDSLVSFEKRGTKVKMIYDRRWVFDKRLGLEELLRG
ncbi:hypothetical protein RHODOSMS8_03791 [Rhodobiaceae bacterium]|nr:hypothetical protein RHODOSMS8_03791 [Rhodobiaceae bacterium]